MSCLIKHIRKQQHLKGLLVMRVNPFASQQQEQALNKIRSERYSEIMAHERAHQSAAGGFAGGITINYDKNGVAFSGSVPISVPALNPGNPNQSILASNTIRNAALAPSRPSSADNRVAGIANVLISKARQLIGLLTKNSSAQKETHGVKPHNPFIY